MLDLSTRNGLKHIHKSFEGYVQRLNKTYDLHYENDKIVGGVIGIYAKMCADSLLRNKLFKDSCK